MQNNYYLLNADESHNDKIAAFTFLLGLVNL